MNGEAVTGEGVQHAIWNILCSLNVRWVDVFKKSTPWSMCILLRSPLALLSDKRRSLKYWKHHYILLFCTSRFWQELRNVLAYAFNFIIFIISLLLSPFWELRQILIINLSHDFGCSICTKLITQFSYFSTENPKNHIFPHTHAQQIFGFSEFLFSFLSICYSTIKAQCRLILAKYNWHYDLSNSRRCIKFIYLSVW